MVIPEEVQRRWAAKAESLVGLHALALPCPSAIALALSGETRVDPELARALRLIARLHPDELPLDGGAAKCRQLDSAVYDDYKARTGGRPRGPRALEAVWFATDEALYYVSPAVEHCCRWIWQEIEIQPVKQGRKFGRIRLGTAESIFKVGLGSAGMANLLAVYSWNKVRQNVDTDHDASPARELQKEYAYLNAELAPLLEEARRMAEIKAELAALGAEPDPKLNRQIKRELGVAGRALAVVATCY